MFLFCVLNAMFLNKLCLNYKVSFSVVCSLPRSFFDLNQLRIVWKDFCHSTFSLQAIILFFFYENIALCYIHVFWFLWVTLASFGYASGGQCASHASLPPWLPSPHVPEFCVSVFSHSCVPHPYVPECHIPKFLHPSPTFQYQLLSPCSTFSDSHIEATVFRCERYT